MSKWIFNFLIPPTWPTEGARNICGCSESDQSHPSHASDASIAFFTNAPVPIEFTAIVCQALHLWFSPQACFAFYLFWRFSRRQQKFDLGQERKSLIRSKCQWVCPCHTAQIRRRWKQLGRTNRDLGHGGFLLKRGRQVDTTWAQWGENSWRTLESS